MGPSPMTRVLIMSEFEHSYRRVIMQTETSEETSPADIMISDFGHQNLRKPLTVWCFATAVQ